MNDQIRARLREARRLFQQARAQAASGSPNLVIRVNRPVNAVVTTGRPGEFSAAIARQHRTIRQTGRSAGAARQRSRRKE